MAGILKFRLKWSIFRGHSFIFRGFSLFVQKLVSCVWHPKNLSCGPLVFSSKNPWRNWPLNGWQEQKITVFRGFSCCLSSCPRQVPNTQSLWWYILFWMTFVVKNQSNEINMMICSKVLNNVLFGWCSIYATLHMIARLSTKLQIKDCIIILRFCSPFFFVQVRDLT